MADPTPPQSALGLAVETSSRHGSVALGRGPEILKTRRFPGPRKHAVEFIPAVDAMCKACDVAPPDIRLVFVSAGPGSFTGLRVGVTAARTIALANGAKTVAVPTMDVIAQNAADASGPLPRLAVILDAKRGRVFAASFARRDRRYVRISEPAEVDPTEFLAARGHDCAVVGEGVACHRSAVEAAGVTILPESLFWPRCETVYRLGLARAARGQFDDPRSLVPVYVRPPEAAERWEERRQASNC
jgi:tRNA threonylcarbamoyladenosine biosynthesis protein TsaB